MSTNNLPEYWMRGPVENIPPLLQPVAHALLQARDEINEMMHDFPQELLFEKPAGAASPAFHVRHISGVLDRLFTYASGQLLSDAQLQWLAAEGAYDGALQTGILLQQFNAGIDKALNYLAQVDEQTLTQFRGVGRKRLPSTVIGLLFHAAEHTMRHTGQLLVTVKILRGGKMIRPY